MGKRIKLEQPAYNTEKLEDILSNLDGLKTELAEVIDECESNEADEEILDFLTEALESMDTALDAISDVLDNEG